MTRLYLGVDPGAAGGLAALFVSPEGERVECVKMPQSRAEVLDWIMAVGPECVAAGAARAAVEQVGGYVSRSGDGEAGGGQPGSAAFKFGMQYERVLFALEVAGVPADQVTPQVWQRKMGVTARKKGESKSSYKNRLKARARQLFPRVTVTLNTCDALLLAEFCRRKERGTL